MPLRDTGRSTIFDLEDVDLDEAPPRKNQRNQQHQPPNEDVNLRRFMWSNLSLNTELRTMCAYLGFGVGIIAVMFIAVLGPPSILRGKIPEINPAKQVIQLEEPQTPGYVEEGLMVCGSSIPGTSFGASSYFLPTCDDVLIPNGTRSTGHWYSFIGTGDCVRLSTCHQGTEFDTSIRVYTGELGVLNEYICKVGNDDADDQCSISEELSVVSFQTKKHTFYSVFLGGFDSSSGSYVLSMECSADCKNII